MFFLGVATFYLLGDKLINAYTISPLAIWVLLGLAIIELMPRKRT